MRTADFRHIFCWRENDKDNTPLDLGSLDKPIPDDPESAFEPSRFFGVGRGQVERKGVSFFSTHARKIPQEVAGYNESSQKVYPSRVPFSAGWGNQVARNGASFFPGQQKMGEIKKKAANR